MIVVYRYCVDTRLWRS